jgi:hypothetical protein
VLPPFAEQHGRASRYSIGDLLAASILSTLTESCGIRVGLLAKLSSEIVAHCNAAPWASLEGRTLCLDLMHGTCRFEETRGSAPEQVVILFPLSPVMTTLRDALLRSQPSMRQHSLLFPPLEVGRKSRLRRRAQ